MNINLLRALIASTLLLSMSFSGAALANRPVSPAEQVRVRRVVMTYGDCVIRHNAGIAIEVVVAQIDSVMGRSRYRDLFSDQCIREANHSALGYDLRFQGDSFTDMLSDALVRRYYSSNGPTDYSHVPLDNPIPTYAPNEADLARMGASDRRRAIARAAYHRARVIMRAFGDCVARAQPENVRHLALTTPASDEETAVLATLASALAQCLPQNQSFHFDRGRLRGATSTAYFRLAYALQTPTGESTAAREH